MVAAADWAPENAASVSLWSEHFNRSCEEL